MVPSIIPQSFVFDSVPIWIKLAQIFLEMQMDKGLVVIASAVGNPVALDIAIKEKRRLSFVRVCMEAGDSVMPPSVTV